MFDEDYKTEYYFYHLSAGPFEMPFEKLILSAESDQSLKKYSICESKVERGKVGGSILASPYAHLILSSH